MAMGKGTGPTSLISESHLEALISAIEGRLPGDLASIRFSRSSQATSRENKRKFPCVCTRDDRLDVLLRGKKQ